MGINLRDVFTKNKYFIYSIIIFLIFSMVYGFSKVGSKVVSDKEVVNIVLPDSEITEGLKAEVDKFNIENKDIEINFESYETDYINVAITKVVNSRDIDIFQYFDNFLVDKGEVENLDNINIDYSNIDDDSIVKFNDKIIGVRYGEAVPKMVVNKEILKSAGIEDFKGINTFDDLIDIASKIKKKVPGVIPIGISSTNIDNVFMMFGNNAAMNNNIYPTFWNYEKGKYTFDESKEILEMYRKLYSSGLINEDFNTIEHVGIYSNFLEDKIAITFADSVDGRFLEDDTEDMDIAIQDMPIFKSSVVNKRYYNPSTRIMVVRNYDKPIDSLTNEKVKDMDAHKNAVKVVYEWLTSTKVKNSVINNDINSFSNNRGYSGDNENSIFKHAKFDPSAFIQIDRNRIRDTFTELIKGNDNISAELIKLEDDITFKIKNSDDIEKINLGLYKENN